MKKLIGKDQVAVAVKKGAITGAGVGLFLCYYARPHCTGNFLHCSKLQPKDYFPNLNDVILLATMVGVGAILRLYVFLVCNLLPARRSELKRLSSLG